MPPIGQVHSLSDEELSEMLKEYGVNVGPINVATRRTYENYLEKLRTGQSSPPSQFEPVDDDEEDDEVILKQPAQAMEYQTQPPSQPRQRREVQDSHIPTPRGDGMSRPSLYSSRKATASTSPPYSSARQPQPAERQQGEESSGGIPTWVKLTAVAIVVVLLFLIYTNMEPNAVSNIPTLPPKVEV